MAAIRTVRRNGSICLTDHTHTRHFACRTFCGMNKNGTPTATETNTQGRGFYPWGGDISFEGNQGRASTAVGHRDQDESSQPQKDQKQPSLRPVQLQLIPVRAGLHAVIHRHGHPAAPGAPMLVPVPHSWGSRMCLYQTIFGTPQNSEIPWPLGCTVFTAWSCGKSR